MPSRQFLHQQKNLSRGMCVNHKDRPVHRNSRCEDCYETWLLWSRKHRLDMGIPVRKKIDLSNDPLTGPLREIAARNHCSITAVHDWLVRNKKNNIK